MPDVVVVDDNSTSENGDSAPDHTDHVIDHGERLAALEQRCERYDERFDETDAVIGGLIVRVDSIGDEVQTAIRAAFDAQNTAFDATVTAETAEATAEVAMAEAATEEEEESPPEPPDESPQSKRHGWWR